ncbi:hypothetical protein TNCV_165721 [Trichonephila clavipes]|nr:hypothetical protein TNCV_165721 [Trichonephila clavipes]
MLKRESERVYKDFYLREPEEASQPAILTSAGNYLGVCELTRWKVDRARRSLGASDRTVETEQASEKQLRRGITE